MSTARSQVERAGRQVAPWLEALARFGYASKGVVYGTIGFLALSLVLGAGGTTTDTRGALLRLQDLPGGSVLLWVLVVGLTGYALWQLLRAVLDPEHQGTQAKGLVKRAGYAISGVAYLVLAVFSARIAAQGSAPRDQNSEAQTASQVLQLPGGQLLLGLAGVVLLAVAANQLYSAYGAKFMKRMAFTDVGAQYQGTLKRIGQVGVAARGLLLTIVGIFLLVAAWRNKASIVIGTSEALAWLRDQPAGQFLLGAVALGTLCYGVWCVTQALYRRINVID
ncbi:DUF1206 domain-containing protein [Deinococcus humi]|uniref:DUF1206 domain-containing protein n=1 Tax=Deinococcus humi TaxID=662880 RepID=A0A7W8JY52_9DEIO|nr:DUF1206 domain-containing protein [Deinococcus humi]MBB5365299.1 hypothetical protein [Deinococcus humi]GGO35948.1 membrane protein [Deinococcus humi]